MDDQSPEDLATGLAVVRESDGVVDVFTYAGSGKKNRMSVAVRVLCQSEVADNVAAQCFAQTTTLGLRESTISRRILSRTMRDVHVAGADVRVKVADRAAVRTAKAEHDVIAAARSDRASRQELAAAAEAAALQVNDNED